MTTTEVRSFKRRDFELPITEAVAGRLLTKSEADETAQLTWNGLDASEWIDRNLEIMVDDEVFVSGDVAPMTVEQVGVLTLLADTLETTGRELEERARRIREAAINLYQQAPVGRK